MKEFLDTYWSIEIMLQLLVPIYLLCHHLPRRPGFPLRVLGVAALLFVCGILPIMTGVVTGLTVEQAFVVFGVLLALLVPIIGFLYAVSPWQALFCASAGYTLQNLASGLSSLVQLLIMGRVNVAVPWPGDLILRIAVPAAVYVAGYFAFIRRIDRRGLLLVENRLMLMMLGLVVCVIIGFDLIIKGVLLYGTTAELAALLRVAHAGICIFVLFTEYEVLVAKLMTDEKAETERILAERERQYQLSRKNIDAINIKCHDIKHQIRTLMSSQRVVDPKAVEDIAREIDVYDSVVETGNEALDTILTEKSLLCSGEGITLSVIADGGALGFMAPYDIYSLFGNALDNAIEAERGLADEERRTIMLSVNRRGEMVAINVENWCAEVPRFREGLPVSTKGDAANHGFGMRSMAQIVARYGGSLHAGVDGQVFYLNMLVSQPE